MFLKQSRNTVDIQNFNPPPGYYVGNERIEQQAFAQTLPYSSTQTFNQGSTFPKADRFKPTRDIKTNESFMNDYQHQIGFDKIAKETTLKSHFDKERLTSKNFTMQSQKQARQKTIVHKQTAQSLLSQMSKFLSSNPIGESQDGITMLQRQGLLKQHLQGLQDQIPGPGHYELVSNLVKPKIQTFTMRDTGKTETRDKLKQENSNENQQIWGQGFQNKKNPSSHEYNYDDGRTSTEQRGKKDSFKYQRNKEIGKQQILKSEFNLELLLSREKLMPQQQQVPPPGWYYTEEYFSQFGRLKEKSYQNQCFDSRKPRFDKNQYVNPNPGPGEYDVKNMKRVTNAFIPATKMKDNVENKPAVGDYEIRSSLQYQKQTRFQRLHNRGKEVDYPAIFGSSTKRDQNDLNGVPGPGSYNIMPQPQRPPKYMKKSLMTSSKQTENLDLDDKLLFGLAVTADQEQPELFQIKNVKQGSKVKKQKQSSMFQSGVQRFIRPNYAQTSDQVGPGLYQQKLDSHGSTFDTQGGIMSKGYRNLNLTETKIQTSKTVGPGSYDSNIDFNHLKFMKVITIK